jgi:hypothetical protein
MLKKLIALALLAAVFSSPGWINYARVPAQTASDETFIVGILRADGVIAPFARYANPKWTNPWHSRQPNDQPDELDTIADLPKPWFQSFVKPSGEWYLWSPAGEPTTIKTSDAVQVCSHCQQVWGVLSDYPNQEKPEKNQCVPNLGAVLSEKTQGRAMEKLTVASADWKQMMTFLGPVFERAESSGLLDTVGQYSAQLPPAEERARKPLSILNLYRSQLTHDGQLLFYFEASKQYPKPPDSNDVGCDNISLLGGWALRDAQGNLALLDSQFNPTDCDWKEGGRVLPFVILQLDGKTFAIVEEPSYEGESYTILEIKNDGVRRVLETYAGSC